MFTYYQSEGTYQDNINDNRILFCADVNYSQQWRVRLNKIRLLKGYLSK